MSFILVLNLQKKKVLQNKNQIFKFNIYEKTNVKIFLRISTSTSDLMLSNKCKILNSSIFLFWIKIVIKSQFYVYKIIINKQIIKTKFYNSFKNVHKK